MQNSFVIDQKTRHLIAGKTLLLDTSALIDAYRLPSEFYDLANEFAALECWLVTTKSIVLEFLGGTKNDEDMQKKQKFLEATFGKKLDEISLPLERLLPETQQILAFSRQANRFSVTDFELYTTLLKYGDKIALVSRNHKDFTATLLPRISFITLLGNAEIHTYGVYSCQN